MLLRGLFGAVLGGNSFRESSAEKGMVLPFTPLAMSFSDVHYYVDIPAVSLFTLLCNLCFLPLVPDLFPGLTVKYITSRQMVCLHRYEPGFVSV